VEAMFIEFATRLAAEAYPHLARPAERSVLVESIAEEANLRSISDFHESLTEEQAHVLHVLASTDDPRLEHFLDEMDIDGKFERTLETIRLERLNAEAVSLLPDPGPRMTTTFVTRASGVGPETAARITSSLKPRGDRPTPPAAPPPINVNLGRRRP
jgi:hypothetical protein